MVTPDEVHAFWFGDLSGPQDVARDKQSLWFGGGAQVDAEITARFGEAVKAARRGELVEWEATTRGVLAKLLVLDQFTRNIWRGEGAAFEGDGLARALSERLLKSGQDRTLYPIERVFAYLPFEHSEAIEDQDRSVALFESLVEEAPEEARASFAYFLEFAVTHRDIIVAFGRYPHRNEALGRASAPAEVAYLRGGGESFGQKS